MTGQKRRKDEKEKIYIYMHSVCRIAVQMRVPRGVFCTWIDAHVVSSAGIVDSPYEAR